MRVLDRYPKKGDLILRVYFWKEEGYVGKIPIEYHVLEILKRDYYYKDYGHRKYKYKVLISNYDEESVGFIFTKNNNDVGICKDFLLDDVSEYKDCIMVEMI